MESRIQRIFLSAGLLLVLANSAWAQDESSDQDVLEAIISPDIKRRQIDEDKIDTENFGFGIYTGVMSVEDFGSNNVFGVRLSYLISEDWFIEAAAGTTKTSETSFETLSGTTDLLTESQRELTYYNVSLGLNLFPGEIFLGKKYAFNSSYYLVAGVGDTSFADNEFFTLNFGGGFQASATDWMSFRIGFRNHLMTHNIFGEDKSIQNLEAVVGLSLFL